MGDTSISWTNKTWNVVRGCSRVSEGCRNCYAERQAMRFAGPGGAYEGLVTKRLKVVNADEPDAGNYVEAHWTGKVVFDIDHLADPLSWKRPCRVFVNSMSDVFHESLTNDQIAAIFGVMAAAKHHTFQVLTKRAKRMRAWFAWVADAAALCNGGVGMPIAAFCFAIAQKVVLSHDPVFDLYGKPTRPAIKRGDVVDAGLRAQWPLPNVWTGVSVENQDAAAKRIPDLLSTPAAIRFLSCEPLIDGVDLRPWTMREHGLSQIGAPRGLHWVIAGAESGPRARRCEYRWIRALRDQCKASGTAFFLKQAEIDYETCKSCLTRVRYYVVSESVTEAACGCTVEGPEICNPPPVAIGEGSKEKARYIVERPYLDGRQHLEFPG